MFQQKTIITGMIAPMRQIADMSSERVKECLKTEDLFFAVASACVITRLGKLRLPPLMVCSTGLSRIIV